MKIIGINHGEQNSSVALLRDGLVIAAAPEERFLRQKKTKKFPTNAFQFCLSYVEVELTKEVKNLWKDFSFTVCVVKDTITKGLK